MTCQDQTETVAYVASAAAHGGAAVELVETHASIVFLAGSRALKLKRAVRYDYLDFSTVERRREMCDAEVGINRRTAPDLYRGIIAVTREADGSLALGGSGTPVDWVVEMTRFDQGGLFDRLAGRGALDPELMGPLADAIARLHRGAQTRTEHGGRAGMAWVVNGNAAGLASQGAGLFDRAAVVELMNQTRDALDLRSTLLDARHDAGLVRQCHGDLHLRNIVLIDGRPTLFDAIEFNDEISCIDVLYDLAFLLMDLWRRRLPRHANIVWNRYLADTLDLEGLPLMPLFLSCRAAVRAKTSATAARLQSDPARCAELQALARGYLALARSLLRPADPGLIAVGGPSGSGKSTLAIALAPFVGPVPGAVVIRSDEIRKRLFGVDLLTRLGPEGYTPDVTRRVYATVAELADAVVRSGQYAIVDAVFARPSDRAVIQQTAHAAGVPFAGLWLDAPEPVLIARTEGRPGDPSDATAEVIRQQLAQQTGTIDWHRVDAASAAAQVLTAARAILGEVPAGRSMRLQS